MSKWLGRFSFSLLAIAFVLAYEGYRMYTGVVFGQQWKVGLYFAGAILCLAAALVGAKERHRRQDWTDRSDRDGRDDAGRPGDRSDPADQQPPDPN